jgi:hypothetical protein
MQSWYEPGRKKDRRHRGIIREPGHVKRVKGAQSVFTVSVRRHYRRLRRPVRQQGLWNWDGVAAAMHKAGIPVHSGTIPVERLWASLKGMLPTQGRRISKEWFDFVSSLCFLRYNYLHFHSKALPSWTDSDSLLAQRLDGMVAIAESLAAGTGLLQEIPFMTETTDVDLDVPSDEECNEIHGLSEAVQAEAIGVALPSAVYMRVLDPEWATALADGLKWVETQRYRGRALNMMKFAGQGTWLVFGPSSCVHGVAVLEGPSVTKCSSVHASGVLDYVIESLHEKLISYLQSGTTFDYVKVSAVYDLRASELSWRKLWAFQEASEPGNKQGFKKIGSSQLAARLLSFVDAYGVTRTPYDTHQ